MSQKNLKMDHDKKIKDLGRKGEDIAADFLLKKNYEIIDRNFHAQSGEIDLVAKNSLGEYVLVEVKTRANNNYGYAIESMSKSKLRKIYYAGGSYFLRKMKLKELPDFQIDLIAIQFENGKMEIEHIENIGLQDF